MKNSIRLLLTEAKEKMNAYTVYMNYQFMNFSVKAEPAALLSVEVEIDDEKVYLENTADVAIPEDDQFAIIPKDQAFLFAISKAIAHAHPEYRQEQKELEQDEENADMPQSPESSEDTDKYLLCTMPEINKDRHDAGMDYVKMIYDEATGRLEAARVSCEVKMAAKLKDAQPKETDEANDELKKIYDQQINVRRLPPEKGKANRRCLPTLSGEKSRGRTRRKRTPRRPRRKCRQANKPELIPGGR